MDKDFCLSAIFINNFSLKLALLLLLEAYLFNEYNIMSLNFKCLNGAGVPE